MPYQLSMKVGLAPDEVMSLENDSPTELLLAARPVTLKTAWGGFRLVARGFDSTEDATVFAQQLGAAVRVWAAERWAMATAVTDVTRPRLFDQPITITDDPRDTDVVATLLFDAARSKGWSHVDGIFDESQTVVYEDTLNVLCFGSSATPTKGHSLEAFAACVEEALEHAADLPLVKAQQTSLVIDLAIAAHKERSPRAKLFGLVSTLEAMVDDEKRPEHIQRAVDAAIEAVFSLAARDSNHKSDYVQLAQELAARRYLSVRSRLERLMLEYLPEETPHGTRAEVVDLVLGAPGKTRSKLIHGHADPSTLDLDRANIILGWAIVTLIRRRLSLVGDPPVSL